MVHSCSFLGVRIHTLAPHEATQAIIKLLRSPRKHRIYFVNAHCINVARHDHGYLQTLHKADLVLPDGSGVLWSAKLLGLPIRHNLNGTDFIPKVLALAEAEGRSVYLLGSKPGVAEEVVRKLQVSYPYLHIAGTRHGYFAPDQTAAVISEINAARPDILLVALGVPFQERWISEHQAELDVSLCFAVGGLFDFLAAKVKRAPHWMRALGMEWFYRLLQEPGRLWKRYLIGNFVFIMRVLLALVTSAHQPMLLPSEPLEFIPEVSVPEPVQQRVS